ncbi:tetratricopeptide repeat protein [Chitinophaga horti]|uniref:Tetratricopeptide repeat protein n=1 Tax=Chitinophaga horti TaxID=2920382 RepID=A0ABY6IZ96_9BACT|nr:tetratricopeptide repeat protein [Chitinophaga horti]UYQ92733.1 tetratricopeptide repeat protein [Chitinophaga horti]
MNRSILNIRTLMLAVASLVASVTFAATPPQQRFEQANKLYKQQQYSEAASLYQQLIDEGYLSAELYVNAGNAYYRSNAMGEAIYSYEKAQQLDPSNEAAPRNLALANQKTGSTAQALPLLFFEKWWIDAQQLHSANGWAVGTIVLFWLLIILYGIYRFGNRQLVFKLVSYATAVLFVGYFVMAAWVYNRAHTQSIAIVMQPSAHAKAAPDDSSKDVFEVKEGFRLEVLERTGSYYKVALADGKSGWVPISSIKTL